MFVDHINIFAKAGDGGHGSSHFRRKKFLPKGGPDGGDGGRGGNIVLIVDHHTDNLKTFFFNSKVKAESGRAGGENQKSGKSGKDLNLKVPLGTIVYREIPGHGQDAEEFSENQFHDNEVDSGQSGTSAVAEDQSDPIVSDMDMVARTDRMSREAGVNLEVVADLTEPGQRFVLCKGGKGGRGNYRFKNAVNQAPEAELATPGEEGEFYLELRQIADAGMVGFPNAGKSTLVGKLSAAQPKVAAYPFTTLKPKIGVIDFPGFKRATVADIPGLIEGAHRNVGLGHDFLRHIMRCRLLLFVVDMAGSETRDPIEDVETLRKELSLYDESLGKQPWLVVANKMDLPEADALLERFRIRFPKVEVIPISAINGEGIEVLKNRLGELVSHRPA